MADYDTIFIGSGHATWHAAVTLARAQQKVAIIEEDTIAGHALTLVVMLRFC